MRILITGGCGYLGSNLAIYLSNFGHKIILGTRKKEFYVDWLPSAEIIYIDWNSYENLFEACKGVDQIIHAAGMNSQECLSNPISAMKFNCETTIKFAEAALKAGVKRFIFLSTIHVYSSKLIGVFNENSMPSNSHPYAVSKIKAEEGIKMIYEKSKDRFLILRLANVIGAPVYPSINHEELLAFYLCKKIINKENIFLKNPYQIRDFISIQYLMYFFYKSINFNFKKNILNIASGNSLTVKEFAELCNEVSLNEYGYKVNLKYEKVFIKDKLKLNLISASPFKNLSNDLKSEIKKLLHFCSNNS